MPWASSSVMPAPELHVEVNVALRARLAAAQLVEAHDPRVGELDDRLADRLELGVGERLVDEHPRGPREDAHARRPPRPPPP